MYKMAEQEENIAQEQENSSDNSQRDVVTIVLTAENFLGHDAFGQQRREERQQRLRDSFGQAVTFAIGQKADFFIQAGDLFDTTTPTERDRSFVAARLAQLKGAGVQVIALGGAHDTPVNNDVPAPQISYAQLGALHYLSPLLKKDEEVEPLLLTAHGVLLGVCGLGSAGNGDGNPLAQLRVQSDIERAVLPILVVYAPIEGMHETSTIAKLPEVSRASIEQQHTFRYILAGYDSAYHHQRIGGAEVIVAGATHSINETSQGTTNEHQPGFVFMGLASDGLRWCNHIVVDALRSVQVRISAQELWSDDADTTPTERILERLEPLCDAETTIGLRLEGEITRRQFHQLDLNRIRRYGEEHCFSLAIDDSNMFLISDLSLVETGERLSPREELIALVEEEISDTRDEQEQQALRSTKEE